MSVDPDIDLSILTPGPSPRPKTIYGRTQYIDSYGRIANRMSRAAALWALMRRCEVSEFEITEQEMDQIASSLPTLTMFRCPTKNVVIVRAEHHND